MRINRGLLNWGVFLIALGGVPLAVERGWLDEDVAADLLQLWPLILVGIGLGLILRWTPAAWLGGAVVAATFGILFGSLLAGATALDKPISAIQEIVPAITIGACSTNQDGETSTTEESGFTSDPTFRLDVDLSCGELAVTRDSAPSWTVTATHASGDPPRIDGDAAGLSVRQDFGEDEIFVFGQQTQHDWDITLPSTTSITLDSTLNASDGTADLGSGPIDRVRATLNASDLTLVLSEATTPDPADLDLTLNASSASVALPDASIAGDITLNFSAIELCLPTSAAVHVELESTLGSDDLADGGLSRDGDAWQTEGYDAAPSRVDLSITSTLSSVSIERAEVCP